MAVESRPKEPADAQSATITTNVAATIRSRATGGRAPRAPVRPAAGASGVDVTSGFMIRCSRNGISIIAASVGTDAATSHEPNVIVKPELRASSAPSGLPAIAVNHSADDRLRLTMPENIK